MSILGGVHQSFLQENFFDVFTLKMRAFIPNFVCSLFFDLEVCRFSFL